MVWVKGAIEITRLNISYGKVTGYISTKGSVKEELIYLQESCKSSTKSNFNLTTVIFSKNKDYSEAKFTFVRPPDMPIQGCII